MILQEVTYDYVASPDLFRDNGWRTEKTLPFQIVVGDTDPAQKQMGCGSKRQVVSPRVRQAHGIQIGFEGRE